MTCKNDYLDDVHDAQLSMFPHISVKLSLVSTCFLAMQVSTPDLARFFGWISHESFFVFHTHLTPTWLVRQVVRLLKLSQLPGT